MSLWLKAGEHSQNYQAEVNDDKNTLLLSVLEADLYSRNALAISSLGLHLAFLVSIW